MPETEIRMAAFRLWLGSESECSQAEPPYNDLVLARPTFKLFTRVPGRPPLSRASLHMAAKLDCPKNKGALQVMAYSSR